MNSSKKKKKKKRCDFFPRHFAQFLLARYFVRWEFTPCQFQMSSETGGFRVFCFNSLSWIDVMLYLMYKCKAQIIWCPAAKCLNLDLLQRFTLIIPNLRLLLARQLLGLEEQSFNVKRILELCHYKTDLCGWFLVPIPIQTKIRISARSVLDGSLVPSTFVCKRPEYR